jgi:hypothetical protein
VAGRAVDPAAPAEGASAVRSSAHASRRLT